MPPEAEGGAPTYSRSSPVPYLGGSLVPPRWMELAGIAGMHGCTLADAQAGLVSMACLSRFSSPKDRIYAQSQEVLLCPHP